MLNNGLVLKPSMEFPIDVYVDSDFAGLWGVEDKQDLTSAKSHTGFVICVSCCPAIWSSKLQTDIALNNGS